MEEQGHQDLQND